jgi:hypothetical protein
LLIGALVVVLVGVGLILMPRKQSVASLRKEYLAACSSGGWTEAVRHFWGQLRSRPPDEQAEWDHRRKRIEAPEKALIEFGYLEERTFVASNFAPRAVMHMACGAYSTKFPMSNQAVLAPYTDTVVFLGGRDQNVIARARFTTNAVIIVAPRSDTAKWAELVRDVESAASAGSTIKPADR